MRKLPAEWEPQRFVQLTWPHDATDWKPMLDEVNQCFVQLALTILRFQPLLIVCADARAVEQLLHEEIIRRNGKLHLAEKGVIRWRGKGIVKISTGTLGKDKPFDGLKRAGDDTERNDDPVYELEQADDNTERQDDPFDGLIRWVELPSNDTWARDHGGITVYDNGHPVIYDYTFNGWGQKFEAGLDNALTARLFAAGVLGNAEMTRGKELPGSKGLTGGNEMTRGEGIPGSKGLPGAERIPGIEELSEIKELPEVADNTAGVVGSGTGNVEYRDCLDFVLEGGSLESDGHGTLLTTSECLLSEFRNPSYTKEMIEQRLKDDFGLVRVLWLNHGYLEGDDTDSHIDTLARFCDRDTIAYVRCDEPADAHFEALQQMEQELRQFRTFSGQPYRLIPLPMADAAYDDEGNRLPATYANFLIINGAVLVPTYRNPSKDELAINQLQIAFPEREILGVDCRILIEQHGSLHCVTMQY